MTVYDLVVVGVGGVGSAALCYAARRGLRAVGLEQFVPGHDCGSSHGQTRAIRMAYFEHPDYVPLLKKAYWLWNELEQALARRLFYRVGLLEIGPPQGEVISGVRRSAAEHGLPIIEYQPEEVVGRFPGFSVPEGCCVLFEENAGFLLVEECVLAHLELAERLGAHLRHTTQVFALQGSSNGVEVVTSSGIVCARYAVVTPGPWAPQLLAPLGLPLRVLKKHLHWYRTASRCYHVDAGCPVYFFEIGNQFFYGFPQLDERGIKVAEHTGGELCTDPLTTSRDVDPVDRQHVESFLARCMPQVLLSPTDHAVCFYTMTPDGHFIVDRHPHFEHVSYAAGLSGHGFKFVPVLGQALVELAVDGKTTLPVDFLSAARFNST